MPIGEAAAGPRHARLPNVVLAIAIAVSVAGPALGAGTARDSSRWQAMVRADADRFLSRRTAVILAAGATLTGISLAAEDDDAIARHLSGPGWEHLADVGNAYGHPAVLGAGALVLAAAGEWSGHPRARTTGIEACRSLFYTCALVGGLKVVVSRPRPDGGDHSFPSAHTAAAFAVAPVLARRLGPVAAVPAYALATVTAVARLQARKHHLSDTLFGATLGTAVGFAVARPGDSAGRARLFVAPDRAGFALSF